MVQHQSKLTGIYSCQTALQSTHLKHSFEHFSHRCICTYHTIDEMYQYFIWVYIHDYIYIYVCMHMYTSYRPSPGLNVQVRPHAIIVRYSQRKSVVDKVCDQIAK